MLWNKNVHRDRIVDIDIFLDTSVSTSAVDGYYQILTLEEGRSMCCLSIRHPLPIQWNTNSIQEQQLITSVKHALSVLSQLISDPAHELPRSEFEKLNVIPFLSNFFQSDRDELLDNKKTGSRHS